jgi:hypothetical protein
MSSRTVAAAGFMLSVLLAGCSDIPLGRGIPACDAPENSMVLSVQAIPDTEFVPCINGLSTGWDYQHLEAETGLSVFWLDSDRMGQRFLKVELEPSCDAGGAEQVTTDETDVPLLMDVREELEVVVTVIPEGRSAETFAYGNRVVLGLGVEEEIEGRELVVQADASNTPTGARIERALASGSVVVVLSVRDAEEETMTVILPDTGEERTGLSLDAAFDFIEDSVDPPSYRGNWYYLFDGGCVTYTFDAEGPGVETIEADVKAALGLFDAELFRQAGRDAGFRIP